MSRRDASDLSWLFLEADSQIENLPSNWLDTAALYGGAPPTRVTVFNKVRVGPNEWRTVPQTVDAAPLRCGPIYVPHEHRSWTYDFDRHSMAAVRRAAPILDALRRVGPDVREVLRLCFREKLLVCREHVPKHLIPLIDPSTHGCRVPFGIDGASARRDRPMDGCLGVMLTPLRGAGAAAHLTGAARAAYASDRLRLRQRLSPSAWTDRLGGLACSGNATPGQLELVREIRRQDVALLSGDHGAMAQYHSAFVPARARLA